MGQNTYFINLVIGNMGDIFMFHFVFYLSIHYKCPAIEALV